MKKGTIFQKGEEALLAFKAIKEILISPPILAYPDPNLSYELISDASITDCGAVLTQESCTIAYFSSKFRSAELTKYVCLAPIKKTATSEDVARIFISHVYQHHGMPKVLISDRYTRFISKFWKEFCRCLQAPSRFSTAFHPQTDGQTERTNRVVEEVLRHFVDGDHVAWEDLLPIVTLTMNNAKSSSTGQSPFFLNHGKHPVILSPISIDVPKENFPSLDTVFTDLKTTISKIKLLLQAAQDRQKTYADSRFRAPHAFNEGDQVMLSTMNFKFRKCIKKLHPKFIGPFKILNMTPGNCC
jgi:hypothetical protein